MDTVVIPHIPDGIQRERAIDELPQSSAGRTIMTTEPKFIPEQAVDVQIDEDASFRVRMIDCVGYIVPSAAIGYIEEDQPRMVRTPWYEEPIPFNMAAEIGTKKVITEHSTIGLVITTDGTISDIPREEYEEAEERVIDELNQTGRPYVMLLNCVEPERPEARELAARLGEKYSIPVLPVNCIDITEQDIRDIMSRTSGTSLPACCTSSPCGRWPWTCPAGSPLWKAATGCFPGCWRPCAAPAASTKCARSNPCWNACESVSRSRRCGWAASIWAAAPAGPSWSLTRACSTAS